MVSVSQIVPMKAKPRPSVDPVKLPASNSAMETHVAVLQFVYRQVAASVLQDKCRIPLIENVSLQINVQVSHNNLRDCAMKMLLLNLYIDPCITVDCPPNSNTCKVDGSGTPYCEPSCSLNNGGCLKNETCSLEPVQCVQPPCRRAIKCTYDPCSECTANQICRRTVAPCLVPPCPETTQCLDRKTVCLSPPVTGPCRARILRYFYNNTSGQCERFVYGGCQGNANNFEIRKDCERDCQGEYFS